MVNVKSKLKSREKPQLQGLERDRENQKNNAETGLHLRKWRWMGIGLRTES